jgi:phage-related protein
MTRDDEKLQKLIVKYIEKHGGKRGSLWTLARACYSVGYQSRKRKEGHTVKSND